MTPRRFVSILTLTLTLIAGIAFAAEVAVIPSDNIAAAKARVEALRDAGLVKTQITSAHVDVPAEDGAAWRQARDEGGATVWRLALRSPGASFIRPHFAQDSLPGREVVVRGLDATAAAPMIDNRVKPAPGEGLWGPVVEGEALVVEVQGDARPALTIDRVSHGLAPLFVPAKEQVCHVDVNCDPDWADKKSGIGLMHFEMFGFGSGCTGTLIADVPGTGRPWFLTANHCISTQATTNSLVVFWNYETDSCNGSVPNLDGLPQSAGGTYTAGNSGSDFTLISLAQEPPADIAHLPISTEGLTSGEAITVVHHPDLAYKRITYGVEVSGAGTHWSVKYNEGSTEGGSSGSPLFNANDEIVGQLTGGSAACSRMWGTDSFGKINLSWDRGLSDYLATIPTGYTTTTTTVPPGDDDDDWHDDDDADDDVSDDDAVDDDADDGYGDGDDDDDDGSCCG